MQCLGAGSDFTQLTAFLSTSLVFPSSPGSPTAGPRRECFDVTITDDDSIENTESFSLLLQEDMFASHTEAIIYPNGTDITILDDDGILKSFSNVSTFQPAGSNGRGGEGVEAAKNPLIIFIDTVHKILMFCIN